MSKTQIKPQHMTNLKGGKIEDQKNTQNEKISTAQKVVFGKII